MDPNVYVGVWTNWSRGQIMGSTLTTTKQYGNLLIAFTAFFVAFVGSRFWRILCLILHRVYSTTEDRNAIHHQRQVILRNSASPESGLIALSRLLFAWRKTSSLKRMIGLAPLLLLSLFSITAFTVAGGFSSTISTAVGNEVLLTPSNCAVIPPSGGIDLDSSVRVLYAERLNNAVNYAQQCYDTSSSGALECDKFRVARLPTKVADKSAACPFQDEICRERGANLRLDTGYIDSNDHLGLNAPANQRFAWRYILHCAPLQTVNYTTHVREDGVGVVRYHYGDMVKGPAENITHYDYVYQTDDIDSQYSNLNLSSSQAGRNYRVSLLSAATMQGVPGSNAQFTPITSLQRADGDITLVFLSGNGVLFGQEMDDPWYRATKPFKNVTNTRTTGSRLTYIPEEAASPMGCVEQWQWCKGTPNSDSDSKSMCGPLGSQIDALAGVAPLFDLAPDFIDVDRPASNSSTGSRLTWPLLITIMNPTTLDTVLQFLGAKSLMSQTRLYGGVQWGLPNDQWQLDVVNWWTTLLASIQASFVNTVLAPSDAVFDSIRLPPVNSYETDMCESQTIRSTAYTSVSLFGFCFIFATGFLIVAISYALEPLLEWLHKRYHHKQYAHLEWVSNANLQLHRMAQEELGTAKWYSCTEKIPVAESDKVILAGLDITNIDHPILMRHHVADVTETKTGPASPVIEENQAMVETRQSSIRQNSDYGTSGESHEDALETASVATSSDSANRPLPSI